MQAAHHALIDPLIEPDPSDDTGLNSHFRSTFAPRQDGPITPPGSAGLPKDSPSVNVKEHRTGNSVGSNPFIPSQNTGNSAGTNPFMPSQHTGNSVETNPYRRTRASSEAKAPSAAVSQIGQTTPRSSRKKNFQGADVIDRLDKTGVSRYHHEGPYDAASIARNRDKKYSPVAAVQDSNEEALRATPRENIQDAVERHRPLDGVATVPPGMTDKFGRVYTYEEGTDMQRDPLNKGDYKRVPGVQYHPDDLKGKGEPSYTIEKQLKDHQRLGDSGTEMTTRRHSKSVGHADAPGAMPAENPFEPEASASGIGRSNSGLGSALKKRFGSIRRKKPDVDA